MEPNSILTNASSKPSTNPNWKWQGISVSKKKNSHKKAFPISEFFVDSRKKGDDTFLGPGYGVGIGCGVGVGFGLVGGLGHGRSPWDHVQMVFGFGLGCGVGFGVGYGGGVGYGNSLDYLRSRLDRDKSRSRIVIEI